MIENLKDRLDAWKKFVYKDIWNLETNKLTVTKRYLVHVCKVGFIVVRGFIIDKCILQSAALTFITLMSIVPMLALMLATAISQHAISPTPPP